MSFIIFIFGSAFGSFLNVVSTRYDQNSFMFGKQLLGRSHCDSCGKKLGPLELIPVFSFIFQFGRCRNCGVRLGAQYPIVEILSGLIFVFVPLALRSPYIAPAIFYGLAFLWILVFEVLLLIALVDLRLGIIPDEANILLLVLGIAMVFLNNKIWDPNQSFVGPYALIFGLRNNVWTNHIFAALLGFFLLGLLILVTRGRGMGIGDLKLIFPMGLIFGWPDTVFVLGAAFIIGSFVSIFIMMFGKHTIKSAIPFGPFLSLGATTIFFFGGEILKFYFGLFRG